MLLDRAEVIPRLICPRTQKPLVSRGEALVPEEHADLQYDLVSGCPVVVDFEQSVLHRQAVLEAVDRPVKHTFGGKFGAMVKGFVSPPNKMTRRNLDHLLSKLREAPARPCVLVVGGGTIGQGVKPLYEANDIDVIGFDIYASEHVQFVADAHHIPLADASVDAVVIQAVLEHVLEPHEVVREIARVLRPGGYVYAETPFLSQVHAGAYDFTRFTESGHRYLFRDFDLLRSGAHAGVGTQLVWTVDFTTRCLTRSVLMGKIAKTLCFWLRFLDDWVPEAYNVDGASGVYFLGRKELGACGPKQAITHYKGAQRNAA